LFFTHGFKPLPVSRGYFNFTIPYKSIIADSIEVLTFSLSHYKIQGSEEENLNGSLQQNKDDRSDKS